MLTPKTSKAKKHGIGAQSNMYPIKYNKPAGPHRGCPVSALGGNGSLPDFLFGEDALAFLDKVEAFTVGYTEEQKIKYLLNRLCQNSFDTTVPYLGFSCSYQYLQRVIKQKLHYPQDCTKASLINGLRITSTPQDCHLDAPESSNDSRNSPESPNAPVAGSLNKVENPDSLASGVNQVSGVQYLAGEAQMECVENIFEPKESLTEAEPTKPPIIQEKYCEKKQDLDHEANYMMVLISKNKGTSLAAPIVLLSLDLLEPSPVDHNVRGKYLAKDDDVLLEVEMVGLHTFQKPLYICLNLCLLKIQKLPNPFHAMDLLKPREEMVTFQFLHQTK
ncbi:hypothetical protein DSO57_1016417 [Entomophthora muscae]|uniref:Uncharacterized protein n=1 Tax=Entomophthora muscae TaxID=34485 RepID=A0ACC2TS34_9FUNG|nr:hypothetical protein DSO57_1016417 [Entomophthora muscae]